MLAVIAVGGMLGASARHGIATALPVGPGGFPWATFWTNVSGSLVLGALVAVLLERSPPSRHLRPFLATGLLGGYTTFSTFVVETDLLIRAGHVATAGAYVLASSAGGLLAAFAGLVLARRATGSRP